MDSNTEKYTCMHIGATKRTKFNTKTNFLNDDMPKTLFIINWIPQDNVKVLEIIYLK